jgi:dUTP pyrophosphatase
MEYLTTKLLDKSTETAAGYDLRATEAGVLKPGDRALIKTGIKGALPSGKALLVLSRSGLALKAGVFVLNAPGLVDPDYRGEVGVILFNAGGMDYEVNVGDKIAQALFVDYHDPEQVLVAEEALDQTARGEGGFGSTGVK